MPTVIIDRPRAASKLESALQADNISKIEVAHFSVLSATSSPKSVAIMA
jgi:hypothetical protein